VFGDLYHCVKLGWNRFSSFDMKVWIFCIKIGFVV